jgi:D-alanine-D-alanine ligase
VDLQIFRCPADLTPALEARLREVVSRTCEVLRIRDWCRIDLRLDEKSEPNVLEVNPLPGVLPKPEDNSCLPKAARTAGYSYSALIHRVVDEAAARYGLNHG